MTRKKFELYLSPLQVLLLGLGGGLTISICFGLGIMVGSGKIGGLSIFDKEEVKGRMVKMKIEPMPAAQPQVHTPGNEGKAGVMNNATSKPVITFYDTLIKSKTAGKEPAAANGRKKDDSPGKFYTIQVGIMKDKASADTLLLKLKKSGYSAYMASSETSGKGGLYKVRLGTFSNKEDAQKEALKIDKNEGLSTTVVEK